MPKLIFARLRLTPDDAARASAWSWRTPDIQAVRHFIEPLTYDGYELWIEGATLNIACTFIDAAPVEKIAELSRKAHLAAHCRFEDLDTSSARHWTCVAGVIATRNASRTRHG